MKSEYLIIGIVVAFGVGFLAGNLRSEHQLQPQMPVNYDPARAVISDTVKSLQDSNAQCWQHVQELLIDRAKTAHH